MSANEGRRLLDEWYAQAQAKGYHEWAARLEQRRTESHDIRVTSGNRYAVKLEAAWETLPGGDIHVFVTVDDGHPTKPGGRFIQPLTADFVVRRPRRT
jgi:hypothetical protein